MRRIILKETFSVILYFIYISFWNINDIHNKWIKPEMILEKQLLFDVNRNKRFLFNMVRVKEIVDRE